MLEMDTTIETILASGSLAQIRALCVSGEIAVIDVVTWYLERIERLGLSSGINAVREISRHALTDAAAADAARAQGGPQGPLFGIPVLLKDNVLTSDGMSATAGAAALHSFRPERDATLVTRLRSAGAIIIGKTNMTEFADYVSDTMPSCFSSEGGAVRNPHGGLFDRGQGSSVGSAAAVAAALAPVAIGSETQNSIQAPACHASAVGYKPSVGRVSRAGIIPLVPSQDSPGVLSRSLHDALLVASAISGPDTRDTATLGHRPIQVSADCDIVGKKIGVPRSVFADRVEFQSVMPQFEQVLSRLREAGATIVDPCDLPRAAQLRDVTSCVFRTEFKHALNDFLADHDIPSGVSSIQDLIAWNRAYPDNIPYGQSLLEASAAAGELTAELYISDRSRDIFLSAEQGIDAASGQSCCDVLICPMSAAAKATGKAGAPVVAIPAGVDSSGKPFGITLFAPRGEDERLLEVAIATEKVVGKRVILASRSC